MNYLLTQTHPGVVSPRQGSMDNTSLLDITDFEVVRPDPGYDCVPECSTGISYVPGKYLRPSPHVNDTYLWPAAVGSDWCDGATATVLAGTRWRDHLDAPLSCNVCWRPPQLSLTRHRSRVLIAVCLVVAIIGLGGLTTVI